MGNLERRADLYAFGDSLADDGGTFETFALAPEFGGTPFPVSPPYAEGRYSNGPMWTEYLADSLGMASTLDRNFAIGGATAGLIDDPADPRQTVGNFQGQIDLFEARYGRFGPDDLVTVTFGGNDLPLVARVCATEGVSLEAGVDAVVASIVEGLERLVALGAEQIVVTNVPDLALVPFVDADPEAVEAEFGINVPSLTALTQLFNESLATATDAFADGAGVNVEVFDTYGLFETLVADPGRFRLTNVEEEVLLTRSSAPDPVFNPAIDGADPEVADATLFFDQEFHPTTSVHEIFGLAVREMLRGVGLAPDGRLRDGSPDDDWLSGRGKADVLLGRGGNDLLLGRRGSDALIGGAGDDLLFGGRGHDRVEGGAGDDLMVGGHGSDLFVFEDAFGADTILGFRPGADQLDFSGNPSVPDFDALDVSASFFGTTVKAPGGSTVLLAGVDLAAINEESFIFA